MEHIAGPVCASLLAALGALGESPVDPWQELPSGTDRDLHGVAFVDERHGFAVGRDGTLLETTDGGDRWIRRPVATAEHLRSIAFAQTPGDRFGYIVGDAGTVLISYDGEGDRWSPRPLGVATSLVDVSDAGLTGVAFGPRPGEVFDVVAGDVLESGLPATFQAVLADRMVGGTIRSGERERGVIYAVVAAGAWKPLWRHRGDGYYLRGLAAHGQAIVGCGYPSTRFPGELLVVSADGGASWREIENAVDRMPLFDCAFSGDVAYAVGDGGSIIKSIDGGASWTASRVAAPDRAALYGVAAAGSRVWAVGAGGAIWRLESI
jgi:photosystem II stability/assembly factor-like uncharacterized protein